MIEKLKRGRRLWQSLKASGPGSRRFHAFWRLGRRLLPEYRFRWMQLDWAKDAAFNRYLNRFEHTSSLNSGRRWMVPQLLRLVANVPGDTAECGVFTGGMSYLILKANEASGVKRTHYLFDSFEGLSAPSKEDGDYWKIGDLTAGEAIVKKNLADCRDFVLMRGWIPKRFAEVADARFSFVHIDVDLYEPTRDSLAFFLPRMSEGGIIVVDDYGFSTCPGATRACEEVLKDASEKMLALPDGGGFIIKGRATAPAARI